MNRHAVNRPLGITDIAAAANGQLELALDADARVMLARRRQLLDDRLDADHGCGVLDHVDDGCTDIDGGTGVDRGHNWRSR